MQKTLNGFTLVEILVVATIISLLTATGISSYTQFNKSARDARRKTDVENVRAALEMYRSNDPNGSYPDNLNLLVTNKFLKSIPLDPKGSTYQVYNPLYVAGPTSCNGTSSVCTTYTFIVNLESGGVYSTDPLGAAVTTPGPTSTPATATNTPAPTATVAPTATPATCPPGQIKPYWQILGGRCVYINSCGTTEALCAGYGT